MDRRGFLKGTGLASVAGVAAVALAQANGPAVHWSRLRQVAVGDRIYRVDGSSKVFVSTDGGATWAVHTKLKEPLSIRTIAAQGGRVRIKVGFGHHRFALTLAEDQRAWLTA